MYGVLPGYSESEDSSQASGSSEEDDASVQSQPLPKRRKIVGEIPRPSDIINSGNDKEPAEFLKAKLLEEKAKLTERAIDARIFSNAVKVDKRETAKRQAEEEIRNARLKIKKQKDMKIQHGALVDKITKATLNRDYHSIRAKANRKGDTGKTLKERTYLKRKMGQSGEDHIGRRWKTDQEMHLRDSYD